MCFLNLDVVYCLLNLLAICVGEQNGVSLKLIALFSAEGLALPSIALIDRYSLETSVLYKLSPSIYASYPCVLSGITVMYAYRLLLLIIIETSM